MKVDIFDADGAEIMLDCDLEECFEDAPEEAAEVRAYFSRPDAGIGSTIGVGGGAAPLISLRLRSFDEVAS